jgi:hypothetical protein
MSGFMDAYANYGGSGAGDAVVFSGANAQEMTTALGNYNVAAGENFAQCFAGGPGAFTDTGLGPAGMLPCTVGVAAQTMLTRGMGEAVDELAATYRTVRNVVAPKKSSCPTCTKGEKPTEKPAVGEEAPSKLDPSLKAQVDALKPGESIPLTPGGKDGLLDYLSGQDKEFGIYRGENGMYLTTSGEAGSVTPLGSNDTLIFHNHPNGNPYLSFDGVDYNGKAWGGDLGYIRSTNPDQQSTLLGVNGQGVIRKSANPSQSELEGTVDWAMGH